jgi:diguanylate cyclase (GGDEF)-like protein/PAS domain S-box-containing protein
VVDREQTILFWNAGAERILGHLRQDVVGRMKRETLLASRDKGDSFAAAGVAAIQTVLRDGQSSTINVSLRHKEGHRVLVRLRAVPIRNNHGSVIGAAESFEESIAVSNWDRRKEKLARYGCLDEELGVLNDGYIRLQLKENLEGYQRYRIPFSVLCVRIDRINELRGTYGAKAMTAILRAVAQSIGNSLRPTDFWGRLGDRDFLAILPECNAPDLDRVAQRLQKAVGFAEIHWWGDDLSVTASFGGTSASPGDSTDSLLERAERSLIESSTGGGDRVCLLMQ